MADWYTVGKRFVGSNPIGLGYLGLASFETQLGLTEEFPLPTGTIEKVTPNLRGGETEDTTKKRLFDEPEDMTSRAPAKRIRHHDRDPKNPVGEGFYWRYQLPNLFCGQLNATRLRLPPKEGGLTSKNERKTDFYLKGYKIDFQVHGQFASQNTSNQSSSLPAVRGNMGMCVLNFAIIQFQCPTPWSADPVTQATLDRQLANVVRSQFFSAREGNINNSREFIELNGNEPTTPPAIGARNKWNHYWLNGAINPNNSAFGSFKVLARERRFVQQIVQGGGGRTQKNSATIRKYFRIPQYINLHDNEDQNWRHPLYVIYWVTPLCAGYLLNWPDQAGQTASQFDVDAQFDGYFKDIE